MTQTPTPDDSPRALLDECRDELACPASLHLGTCPWHPDNVAVLKLSPAAMAQLEEQLEAPARHLPRLAALLRGGWPA